MTCRPASAVRFCCIAAIVDSSWANISSMPLAFARQPLVHERDAFAVGLDDVGQRFGARLEHRVVLARQLVDRRFQLGRQCRASSSVNNRSTAAGSSASAASQLRAVELELALVVEAQADRFQRRELADAEEPAGKHVVQVRFDAQRRRRAEQDAGRQLLPRRTTSRHRGSFAIELNASTKSSIAPVSLRLRLGDVDRSRSASTRRRPSAPRRDDVVERVVGGRDDKSRAAADAADFQHRVAGRAQARSKSSPAASPSTSSSFAGARFVDREQQPIAGAVVDRAGRDAGVRGC